MNDHDSVVIDLFTGKPRRDPDDPPDPPAPVGGMRIDVELEAANDNEPIDAPLARTGTD